MHCTFRQVTKQSFETMAHIPRWSEDCELELANLYEKFARDLRQNGNTAAEIQRVLRVWEEFTNVANGILDVELKPQQYKIKLDAWRVSILNLQLIENL